MQPTSRDSSDLPAGWRFDPTDTECMGHLEASMAGKPVHRDLKDVIIEIPGTDGLCRFDPWELPRETCAHFYTPIISIVYVNKGSCEKPHPF